MAKTSRDNLDNPEQRAGGEADYYAVLGVAPGASHETIHQEYRRLAKLWHPDRYTYSSPELRERAERRMRAISRAWAELGDPIRRQAYNQRRYGSSHTEMFWQPATGHHPANYAGGGPGNGAGMFMGMLCVILALPVLINLLNGTLHETWQVLGAGILVLGLAALAGMFFTGDSPLARLATQWAEGEPRGFHDQPAAHPYDGYSPYGSAPGYAFDVADDDDAASARTFDMLVEQALATIPEDFKPYMGNVLVRVEREPTEEELQRMEVGPGGMLFGLYTGVPLTAQGAQAAGTEFVTIYRGPIERFCHGDPEHIRDQVRRTVLHEVAHHFGIDHDDMPEWIK
ncbi:MAG TPA: metallopeptidase family protein [Ktedonobacterales bacterium]